MAKWHLRSKRNPRGGKLGKLKKKRKMDRGSSFLETKIGKKKAKIKRSFGGIKKIKLLSIDEVNLSSGKKIEKTKILGVQENPANPHYVRRNILTKGAIIKTEKGLAKITSRPGRDGVINAVLIQEKGK